MCAWKVDDGRQVSLLERSEGETSRPQAPTSSQLLPLHPCLCRYHLLLCASSAKHLCVRLLLLLAETNALAPPSGGLGVLTTDSEVEVVTDTTVGADLLETLKVVTQLRVKLVRQDLEGLAVDNVCK